MQQLKPVNVVIAGGGFVGLTLLRQLDAAGLKLSVEAKRKRRRAA